MGTPPSSFGSFHFISILSAHTSTGSTFSGFPGTSVEQDKINYLGRVLFKVFD